MPSMLTSKTRQRPSRSNMRQSTGPSVPGFVWIRVPAVELITRRARPGARASDSQEGAGEHGRREARPHVGTNLITEPEITRPLLATGSLSDGVPPPSIAASQDILE